MYIIHTIDQRYIYTQNKSGAIDLNHLTRREERGISEKANISGNSLIQSKECWYLTWSRLMKSFQVWKKNKSENNLAGEKEIEFCLFFFFKKTNVIYPLSFVYLFKKSLVVHFFLLSFNLSYSLYSLINQHFKALLYILKERKSGQAVVSRAKERSML
jgi:hypothetical protein